MFSLSAVFSNLLHKERERLRHTSAEEDTDTRWMSLSVHANLGYLKHMSDVYLRLEEKPHLDM